MSARDRSFTQELGLSQGDVASALGCRQQTISNGFAQEEDYFNLQTLGELEAYVTKKTAISVADFRAARKRYLKGRTLQASTVETDEIADLDYNQLWIVGNEIEELMDPRRARELIQPSLQSSGRSLVYATSDRTDMGLYRKILENIFENQNSLLDVYVFFMPSLGFCPTLRIYDPNTDRPKVFTRMADESYGEIPFNAAKPLIRIFNEHGFGLDPDRFYSSEDSIHRSDDLQLFYTRENLKASSAIPVKLRLLPVV